MTEIKNKPPVAVTDAPQGQSALDASLDAGLSVHDAPSAEPDSQASSAPLADTPDSNLQSSPSHTSSAANDEDSGHDASLSGGAAELLSAGGYDDPYFSRHDEFRFGVATASETIADTSAQDASDFGQVTSNRLAELIAAADPEFIRNAPSYVDPILNQTSAYYWNNGNFGQPVIVKYAFPTSIPAVYTALANDPQTSSLFKSPQGLTSTQRTYAVQALDAWEEVANVDFQLASSPSDAQINFYTSRQTGTGAFAYLPHQFDYLAGNSDSLVASAVQLGGDVWINRDSIANTTPSPGGYGFMTLMHEIGHAIGLKHPGNYNAGSSSGAESPYLPGAQDNNQYSIMSYYPHPQIGSVYPVTPMLYDIAAIQFVYGANYNTRSGDTNYTFATTTQIKAIWDGGGIDTFDASNQSSKTWINLTPGTYSSIGTGGSQLNNIAIAFGANIENATGGSAGDVIVGNALSNVLDGRAGNDILAGGAGNDVLIGGSGVDVYDLSMTGGSWGSDRIIDTDSSGSVIFSGVSGLSALTRQFVSTTSGSDLVLTYRATGAQMILQGASTTSGWSFGYTSNSAYSGSSTSVTFDQIKFYNTASSISATGNVLIAPVGWLRADYLPFAIFDADGDATVSYRFTDLGTGGSSAFLWQGGNLAQGTTIEFSASSLSTVWLGGGSANGIDTLRVQVFDGFEWSSATDVNVMTRGANNLPVVTAATTRFGLNQTVDFASIFNITDADGDTIQQYRVTDATNGGAHLVLNGVQQADGTMITVTAAQMQAGDLDILTSTVSRSVNQFQIQAYDGYGWSNAATINVTSLGPNAVPVVTATGGILIAPAGWLRADLLPLAVTDGDGDVAVAYRFTDLGNGSTSAFLWKGANLAQGSTVEVSASQLASVYLGGGSTNGTDTLRVQVYDGYDWSAGTDIAVSTRGPNKLPVITAATTSLGLNQTVDFSSIFNVTDPDGDTIQQYRVIDATNGGSHLVLNGVQQTDGATITVTAAQMQAGDLDILTSSVSRSVNQFQIQAYDGYGWSNVATVGVTSLGANAVPVVTALGGVLIAPAGWLRADLLPLAVSDGDGDAAVAYRFTDVGTGSTSAFLWKGANLAQGSTVEVSASQLASVYLGGGSANGVDTLSVQVYDGYDWSAATNVSVSTRGANNLPVITAGTTSFGLNQTVDFSSIFNVTDPDGDTIQQYRVIDATNGGAHLILNGVQQTDGATITVTAAQMQAGDLDILTSSVSRSVNQFQIQAYDGYGWSNAATINVASVGANATPVVTALGGVLIAPAGWLRADLLPLAVSDGDGDAAVTYRFTDVGNGSTSAFLWKGANLAQGSTVEVSASQLASVYLGGGSANGVDTLRVQVYDGYAWSAAADVTVSTRGANNLPTITPATTAFGLNQTVDFSSIFNVTDPDGDTIQQYRVIDATNGGSHLVLNGVPQTDGATITVTAAQMQAGDLDILTSSVSRSVNQFQIQAYDGYGWSNAATINVASVGANATPVVTALGGVLLAPGGWLRADLLPLAVSDGDGDAAVTYRFTDVGNGSTSAFLWKGANLAQGSTVEVSASQLSSVYLGGGSANGVDTLRVQVYDGYDWSTPTDVTVSTRGANNLPTITPGTTNFGLNQTVDFSSIFNVTDPDGDTIQQYRVIDATNGGSHLVLNGVQQTDGATITVTAAQMQAGDLDILTSSVSRSVNQFQIQAYDGYGWSNTATINVASVGANAAPVVTAMGGVLIAPSGWLRADLLPFAVTDSDGDAIVTYRLMDVGTGASSAFLWKGANLAQGTTIEIAASQLSNLWLSGGLTIGIDTLRIQAFDGYDWSAAADIQITTDTGGNDSVQGTAGNDTLYGFGGNDTLIGLAGDDTLDGGIGADMLDGGADNDLLYGGSEGDTLIGGAGNDTLNGGSGADSMLGGDGDDVFIVDQSNDVIIEAANNGTDTVQTAGSYALSDNVENLFRTGSAAGAATGNAQDNVLTGNAADDTLSGLGGSDTLFGLAGDDTLDGGTGADTMTGGSGNDVYFADQSTDVVIEGTAGGLDIVYVTNDFVLPDNVENLTRIGDGEGSGTGNDLVNTLTGNATHDTLFGLGGDDTLFGLGGNDTLDGGTGADSMNGGAGNDFFVVDQAGDVVIEAANGGTDTVSTDLSYTLSANLENLIRTGFADGTGTGNASVNILTGNAARDTLYGLDGNDTLYGQDGNDTLDGGTGNDVMTGGAGDDVYYVDSVNDLVIETAGGGFDTIYSTVMMIRPDGVERLYVNGVLQIDGSNGNDNLVGTAGIDTLSGYGGSDTLSGLEGNDTLDGGTGVDTLYGGDGNDRLDGGLGIDTAYGGAGDDIYYVDDPDDVIVELPGEGIDTVYTVGSFTLRANLENLTRTGTSGYASINANSLDNILTGSAGEDWMYGEFGKDTLYGNGGNDFLDGGADDDILDGGAGNDTLAGRTGNDVYYVDSLADYLIEDANAGIDTIYTALSYIIADNFENLIRTGAADGTITGNAGDNVITGNSANDSLFGLSGTDILMGLAGIDTLDGGAGADTMIGGTGNDAYYVDNISDVVIEASNEGTDSIRTTVSFTASDNVENVDHITGSNAITITGNALDNLLASNGSAGDALYGLGGSDTINGFGGDDTIDGGTGADTMNGGDGNDIFYVDNLGDRVIEAAGGGIDTVYSTIAIARPDNIEFFYINGVLQANGASIIGTSGTDTLTGDASNNSIFGFGGSDTLSGLAGNDVLDGGTGNDRMLGGTGDDIFYVDSAGDVVIENASEGTDTIYSALTTDYTLPDNVEVFTATGSRTSVTGNSSANIMTGTNGGDYIHAGSGDDIVYGLDGDDSLNGSGGSDTLFGGAGNDDLHGADGLMDVMTGGAGSDSFSYLSPNEGGDVVTDFQTGAGGDKVDVDGLFGFYAGIPDQNVLSGGYVFAQQGANATTTEIWADMDGAAGAGAAFRLVTLQNVRLEDFSYTDNLHI